MKQFLLFLCFCSGSLLTFGQEIILEADFEKERQRLIDEINPVFAKIKNTDGSIKTILKSDKEAIREFQKTFFDYVTYNWEVIKIDTVIFIYREKQLDNSNKSNRNFFFKKIEARESIYTYSLVTKGSWFYEIAQSNKKMMLASRQKAISNIDTIYAKIEIYTPNGHTPKNILKSDSVAIKQFKDRIDKYLLEESKEININTITTAWIRTKHLGCCLGSTECYVWSLVEVPIDTTITIDVYKLKPQEKQSSLVPTYDFDHEKYKSDVRQKAIDAFNPIYAKIQTLTKNGIETELVLKRDSVKIEALHNNQDLFLYRSELVDVKTSGAYWAKRENSGCSCKGLETINGYCLTWVLLGLPIDTVEIIKIYRSKKALEVYGNDELYVENVELAKEAMQREVDKLNPIYARVETIRHNKISTELILKHQTEQIKTIQNNPEIYVLHDVEFVEINATSTYWKKVKPICVKQGKRNWIWVLDELPIQTTEVIEIYRKQSKPKTEQKTPTKQMNYNVFPNPFSNTITVEADVILNQIIVFDEQGKTVFKQDWNVKTETIDLSDLSQGVYYLKMIGEEFQETVKLVKQ